MSEETKQPLSSKYGECAKHPGNSMIDCVECEMEINFSKSIRVTKDEETAIDAAKNKVAESEGFDNWLTMELKENGTSFRLLVEKLCKVYADQQTAPLHVRIAELEAETSKLKQLLSKENIRQNKDFLKSHNVFDEYKEMIDSVIGFAGPIDKVKEYLIGLVVEKQKVAELESKLADNEKLSEVYRNQRDSRSKDIECMQSEIDGLEEVLADKRRLTKEIDVILNGKNAAESPSLCDVIKSVQAEKQKAEKLAQAIELLAENSHFHDPRVISSKSSQFALDALSSYRSTQSQDNKNIEG